MARGHRGERQSYERLRAHHRQLGVPWTDNSFPANDSSIGLQKVSSERRDLKSCLQSDHTTPCFRLERLGAASCGGE